MVAPTKETTTGCEERLSGSGGLIIMVITDPRLVPTQRVGVSAVGSVKKWKLLVLLKKIQLGKFLRI